jgi:glycine/D-amino acid oxidase-like deaminating enzyme/nitrite reductase/ring-hydroxylating ferredoxin subunit
MGIMRTLDTTSYWQASSSLPHFPKLVSDVNVHAVVIGGGITGITAAYLLKRAGVTVALLERERCATIDTGHTTAHLTCVTDLRLSELKDTFGASVARAVWDAGAAAIDQIVANIRAEDIDCGFRWLPGYLHAPFHSHKSAAVEVSALERDAAVALELGIRAEFLRTVPCFETPGVHFPMQAVFHPLKYLSALVARIPGDGCHIFEASAVDEVETEPLAVKVGDHRVRCRYIIVATHNPLVGKTSLVQATLFQSKLALYTSYALGAKLPSGTIPEGAYWDTADPYGYLRVEHRGSYDYAIYGGEDHKTGQLDDTTRPYERLEKRFLEFAPEVKVDHRWSGQVIETNDGLPFIGEMSDHQFVSTGYAGNGMTFGTVGAMMATDAVLHRKNPWTDLFDPHRTKIRGGTWDYLRENRDYPFYLLRDRLGKAEGDSLDVLERNDGKILKLGGKKVAAYRDAHGHVTLCSPVCTHLQCIVGWNKAEQTWDCPCHGSRFKPTGEVISGPAEQPLEKV